MSKFIRKWVSFRFCNNYKWFFSGESTRPLLFLIFINNLPETVLTSSSYLFADDSKLHSFLTMSDMQHDINCFLYRSGENLIRITIDKCNDVSFKNRDPIGQFFLDGNKLPIVETFKVLGVMISDSLSWDKHIQTNLIAAVFFNSLLMNMSASSLQSMFMNAINASCHQKTNRRLEFLYFHTSQS